MRVLLVGHAISPLRGSEPGNTWNWAWELSKRIEVVVLAHPHYRKEVEGFLAQVPNPNLKVVWVEVEKPWDPWRPQKGERGIRLHYLIWQKRALKLASWLHRESPFNLAHHVSWSSIRTCPALYKMGIPFVWGPAGGGQIAPRAFRHYFGEVWIKETFRSLMSKLLSYDPTWRRKVRNASLILATNKETAHMLEKVGGKAQLFLDCGVRPGFGLSEPPVFGERRRGEPFRLLWAGRFEAIKAFPLALEALQRARSHVELWVAGDGPLRRRWTHLVAHMGLSERVKFLGMVPHEEMPTVFREADAFVFTSLRDSFGSVVLEAMAWGLPVIVPDHQGVGTFVPEGAGIKFPVESPGRTVRYLAEAIELVASRPDLREKMARESWSFAQTERWDRRAERMLSLYEKLVTEERTN